MRCRVMSMVCLLVAGVAHAEPMILLEPTVGTVQSVTLSGRVLKEAPSSGSSRVAKNLRWLATSNAVGVLVTLEFQGVEASVVSGHDGDFELTLTPAKGASFATGWSVVTARAKGVLAKAMVDVMPPSAPFFVISDFDDTLAVTNVVHSAGLVKAALGQDETTQPAVPGMAAFYECLAAGPTERPSFMLVSGSPIQYLERVKGFLLRNGYPSFGIALRDLGPQTLSNYKQPVIRRLLDEVPNSVVLVGDSGEHDPEVYRQMQSEFPSRVKAIYIRNAGHAEVASRFEGMVLFEAPATAARDAVARGLASEACVKAAFGSEP